MLTPMITDFMQPGRLWWLLLVPIIAILYIVLNLRTLPGRRTRSRLDLVLPRDKAWKRHFSVSAALLSLAALVVAYAQPNDFTEVPRDRGTIVVAIDVSRSMEATDVQPNRLDAAKQAAVDFIGLLPARFNVAVVSFSGTPAIVTPPTIDRGMASRAIEGLTLAPSTAISEAIYASLRALELAPPDLDHPDEPAPGAIVLLSDGATNMGRSSSGAAQQAGDQGVPVYTIAYGTPQGYVVEGGRRQQVPVDNAEMARIAKLSGGKKYSAETKQDLSTVYAAISEAIGYEKVTVEVTGRYAGYSLLFAVLAALGVISLAARWP